MIDEIIEQLIYLKPCVITAAIGTILLTVVFLVFCNHFDWNGKNIRYIGFFYDAKLLDSVSLAVCLLKFFLVLSLLFTKGQIAMIHICFYGVLVLGYNICRHNLKEAGVSIFNGVVIMGVLYVANFLISYLYNVLFDIKIVIALIVLILFLALYSLYDLFGCALAIITDRIDGEEEKKEPEILE